MIAVDFVEHRAQFAGLFSIGDRNTRTGFLEQMAGCDAAPGHSQYCDLSPCQIRTIDLDHSRHRSFNVLRLNRARRIAMIQSLTTTFGSSHPFISKWWWMGAIRKIRLPLDLNDST